MLKLITSSRIWKRWEMQLAINYGLLSIGRAVLLVFVYSHWCAARVAAHASRRMPPAPTVPQTYLARHSVCYGIPLTPHAARCQVRLHLGPPGVPQ